MKGYLAIVVLALAISCISAQGISVSGGLGSIFNFDSIRNQVKSTVRDFATPMVDSSPMAPVIRFTLSFVGMSDWLNPTSWTGTTAEATIRNTMDRVNGMIGGFMMG